MSVAHETLPLSSASSSARACRSSARRSCRGRRSPTRACSTGSSSTSSGRLDLRRPRRPGARARRLPDGRGRRRERARRRRRRRPPARVPQHLPPPRRAPRRGRPRAASPRLQCPYHAWTYGFDGSLRNAPFTDELEDFDPAASGCTPVRARGRRGRSCCSTSPATRAAARRARRRPGAAHLARYRLGELRRAQRIVYDVDANWKAIAENYSECLHCPGVHPELNRLSHYLSGETLDGRRARGAAAR